MKNYGPRERATGVIYFYDLRAETKFFSSSPLRICVGLGQIQRSSKNMVPLGPFLVQPLIYFCFANSAAGPLQKEESNMKKCGVSGERGK